MHLLNVLIRRNRPHIFAMPRETTPLLHSDKLISRRLKSAQPYPETALPTNHQSASTYNTSSRLRRLHNGAHAARIQTHRFLTSKIGHYAVLVLVSLDVSCIFADFIISLYRCESFHCGGDGGEGLEQERAWETAQEVLANVSVAFSCLFMAELLASIWGFGPRE